MKSSLISVTGLILFLGLFFSFIPEESRVAAASARHTDTMIPPISARLPLLPDSASMDSLVMRLTDAMRKAENSPGRRVELTGYIPCSRKNYNGTQPYSVQTYGYVVGWSGVTIATGSDIGTRCDADIDLLPLRTAKGLVDKAMKHTLQQFTQRSGEEAIAALRKYYLIHKKAFTISERTALQIEKGTHQFELSRMIRSYEAQRIMNHNPKAFIRLPFACQLGIYSFVYQLGVEGDYPAAVWERFCAGDINQTIAYLGYYPANAWGYDRRQHEIALLRKGMSALEKKVLAGK